MSIVYMKKGDRLPLLRAALKDADGNPLDLTAATVTFRMRGRGGRELAVVDADATVVGDPAEGVVQYAWAAGDTDTPGSFSYEFVVTIGGLAETVPSQGYGTLVVGDVLRDL